MVNKKICRNKISSIEVDGRLIQDPVELHDSVVEYFNHMLADNIAISEEPNLSNFEPLIEEEVNVALCELPTVEKIKRAVFNLCKDDSAGPD